jgi:hypothetical protein
MDRIVINGVAGYNGEHPFDASYFTNKELHTIKRIAGVRAGEIQAAFAAGDNDLIVAFAVIALERNGKTVYEEALWNATVGCIEFVADTAAKEEDADPPANGPEETSNAVNGSSGQPSSSASAHPENVLSLTGTQD